MPQGHKIGLRVKHSAAVSRSSSGRNSNRVAIPEGWFIWVRKDGKWMALNPSTLRFVRERDALRAVHALTTAGLDSVAAMTRAGAEVVQRIATECLQW
jgi:hypothetical protein